MSYLRNTETIRTDDRQWTDLAIQALLEGEGLTKAMDLLMWSLWVSERDHVHPAIWEAAAKAESEHGIKVRPFRKRDIENEVKRFLEVYNAAWERNWGAVPMTREEARHYAKDLKPVLDENWAFMAETESKAAPTPWPLTSSR